MSILFYGSSRLQELYAGFERLVVGLLFENKQETKSVSYPYCQGKVYVNGYGNVTLKDIPIWYGIAQKLTLLCYRYECKKRRKKFTEEVSLRHPGTKVTQ